MLQEKEVYTAKDMRNALLSERAIWVINYRLGRATGQAQKDSNIDTTAQDDIWAAIVPMIHKLNDIEQMTAESTSDVLSLLSRGKITIDESMKLMALLQTKQSIDELPKLIAALEGTIEDDQNTSNSDG